MLPCYAQLLLAKIRKPIQMESLGLTVANVYNYNGIRAFGTKISLLRWFKVALTSLSWCGAILEEFDLLLGSTSHHCTELRIIDPTILLINKGVNNNGNAEN